MKKAVTFTQLFLQRFSFEWTGKQTTARSGAPHSIARPGRPLHNQRKRRLRTETVWRIVRFGHLWLAARRSFAAHQEPQRAGAGNGIDADRRPRADPAIRIVGRFDAPRAGV